MDMFSGVKNTFTAALGTVTDVVHDAATLDMTTDGAEPTIDPGDVIFYQLTSGSTGIPKCIPERHDAIVAHIRSSAQECGHAGDGVTLNWLPFDHVVPMLTFHLADVYLCRTAVQLPTAEVVGEPLLWLPTKVGTCGGCHPLTGGLGEAKIKVIEENVASR